MARLVVLAVIVLVPVFAASASADNTVTITGTDVIPVPPASHYAGSSGGDGWAVALSSDHVYNVFHHSSSLTVACHLQSDATSCWNPITIRQPNGDGSFGFASSGEPGLYLDQGTGKLYIYATRSDATGGVVCFDPSKVGTDAGPFCGFTDLTAPGEAPLGDYFGTPISEISDPVLIGSKWFAFNYVNGQAAVAPQNALLCFDVNALGPCAQKSYSLALGLNADVKASVGAPAPAIAAIGNDVIVPLNLSSGGSEFGCFDSTTLTTCVGNWPASDTSGFIGNVGAPIPLLRADGTPIGFCMPAGTVPCHTLSGGGADTPPGMQAAIAGPTGSSANWNGPAVQLGPRIYVPRWTQEVDCYDFNTQQTCPNFPKSFTNPSLYLLYTVNPDPQRPTCLWVNSDSQTQIQNFDAFTGGTCGEGPIRVRADSFIVNAPRCLPGDYTSLQVTEPAPGSYQSGSVSFEDPSGNPIAGASDVALDSTGTAALSGLHLNTSAGLPQFLITLNTGDNARPGQVVVKLTWQGSPDPTCIAPQQQNTTVTGVTTGTPAGPPPESDVGVTINAPVFARVGNTVTYTDTLKNNGKNTATGVLYQSPLPAGASLVSAKISNGNSCTSSTTKVTCFVGTLNSGSSATVTIVYTANQTGTLTHSVNVQADYDTNPANNVASASTPIIAQGAEPPAPPKPAAPGTFNAIATGTVLVNGQLVTPDQVFLLKAGDIVDVTNGTITITDFDGGFGTFGNVQPSPQRRTQSLHGVTAAGGPVAIFQIDQAAQAGAGVTLTLVQGDFSVCTTPRTLSAAKQTPVRQLWGKAHGLFTTKGRYSAATIRGTIWLEQDRCDGSLTNAIDDVVTVQDLVKNTTVTLNPGQSYLAQPTAPFKPPAVKKHKKGSKGQTVATIRKRGLLWANELFINKAQFTAWLERRGVSWQHFAKTNPKFAEALASRK